MTMQTTRVEFSREEAAKLLRKYQEHKAYQTPADEDIVRLCRLIAKGKIVVHAIESIRRAGVNRFGLPILAIARADAKVVYFDRKRDGSAKMHIEKNGWIRPNMAASRLFEFGPGTFPGAPVTPIRHSAVVPHIPPDIRPARGMANYHLLWEAEWDVGYPIDPMLLRRIGKKGDLWLVCGAWDLTAIERAALSARL